MRVSKSRFFLRILIFLHLFCFTVQVFGFALAPAESFTRQMLHDLYSEKGSIETVFVGASHALYGFDTAILDQELDTVSFNLGSASQSVLDSYFLLREVYRDNRPQRVVLELTYAMYTRFNGFDNPMSSMILFDHIRLGSNKLDYLQAAFTFSDYPDLFLTAYRYRNRIREIPETLKKKLTTDWFTHQPSSASHEDGTYRQKGFVASEGGFNEGGIGRVLPYKWDENQLNSQAFHYLEKIVELCEEQGSELVLVSTPLPMATLLTLGNYDEAHRYFENVAHQYELPYHDFNLVREEKYARPDTDFFDSNHLNGKGASSFSSVFCQFMKENENHSMDRSDWFYPDFNSMKRDYPKIANVYLTQQKEGDKLILTARSNQGDRIRPEYRFLIRKTRKDAFAILQGFSPESDLVLNQDEKLPFEVRVEARVEGKAVFECHDVLILDSP